MLVFVHLRIFGVILGFLKITDGNTRGSNVSE